MRCIHEDTIDSGSMHTWKTSNCLQTFAEQMQEVLEKIFQAGVRGVCSVGRPALTPTARHGFLEEYTRPGMFPVQPNLNQDWFIIPQGYHFSSLNTTFFSQPWSRLVKTRIIVYGYYRKLHRNVFRSLRFKHLYYVLHF